MYAKKSRFRFWPLLLILMLVLGASVGSITAKYIYSQKLEAKVSFTARLADDLLLQEHEAERQPDGSYKLDENSLLPKNGKEGNEYILLPGLDIPKDPFVTVVNKTPIRAYLYIEVTDTTNDAIKYQLAPEWKKLEGVTGKADGTVYVYEKDGNSVLTNANCPTDPIPILAKPEGAAAQIQVSQNLLTKDQENTEDILTFRAYLLEAYQVENSEQDKSPEDVFKAYKES